MLRQASVHQLRTGSIQRATGYIVICMCFHPRNLPRQMRDEYLSLLAPDRALFAEWKEQAAKLGHDQAFPAVDYESRFKLDPAALAELARLARLSEEKPVYLVCQCSVGERCHREMLLMAAKEGLGANVGNIYHPYPKFRQRVPGLVAAGRESSFY